MGLPRRRELAVYRLILELGEANLGVVIERISRELCMTRKTTRNIIKYLNKIGVVDIVTSSREIRVKAKNPNYFLQILTNDYIKMRRLRCRRE